MKSRHTTDEHGKATSYTLPKLLPLGRNEEPHGGILSLFQNEAAVSEIRTLMTAFQCGPATAMQILLLNDIRTGLEALAEHLAGEAEDDLGPGAGP